MTSPMKSPSSLVNESVAQVAGAVDVRRNPREAIRDHTLERKTEYDADGTRGRPVPITGNSKTTPMIRPVREIIMSNIR